MRSLTVLSQYFWSVFKPKTDTLRTEQFAPRIIFQSFNTSSCREVRVNVITRNRNVLLLFLMLHVILCLSSKTLIRRFHFFFFQTKWTCGRKIRRDAGAITIWPDKIALVVYHKADANAERRRRTVVRNAVWSSTARTVRIRNQKRLLTNKKKKKKRFWKSLLTFYGLFSWFFFLNFVKTLLTTFVWLFTTKNCMQ